MKLAICTLVTALASSCTGAGYSVISEPQKELKQGVNLEGYFGYQALGYVASRRVVAVINTSSRGYWSSDEHDNQWQGGLGLTLFTPISFISRSHEFMVQLDAQPIGGAITQDFNILYVPRAGAKVLLVDTDGRGLYVEGGAQFVVGRDQSPKAGTGWYAGSGVKF